MIKRVGIFEIETDDNDNLFFDDDIKKVIMKNDILYGVIHNDGTIKRGYYNTHPKYVNIHLNKKLYWRLWNIWQYSNDERVDKLMSHYCNRSDDDNNMELHFYSNFNLK
jgi:hypothetical protein